MERFDFLKVAGSALAGAVGFAVGFYAALYLILSIWGLSFDAGVFPVIGGGLGSLLAGVAIALTVSRERRVQSVVTSLGFGLILVLILLLTNADAGAMAIGGLALVILTAFVVRSGMPERISGGF